MDKEAKNGGDIPYANAEDVTDETEQCRGLGYAMTVAKSLYAPVIGRQAAMSPEIIGPLVSAFLGGMMYERNRTEELDKEFRESEGYGLLRLVNRGFMSGSSRKGEEKKNADGKNGGGEDGGGWSRPAEA